MTVPICEIHRSPMKQGKNGGWFCPRKVGDAWCDQRVAAGAVSQPAAAPVPSFAPTPASGKTALVVAALAFASTVYRGTGQGNDALMLANQVFAEWKDSV